MMTVNDSCCYYMYRYHSYLYCFTQGSLTAAFIYEAAVAVEMSSCIELLKRGESASSRRSSWRIKYYHIGIFLFIVTCALVSVLGGYIVDSSSDGTYENGSKLWSYRIDYG